MAHHIGDFEVSSTWARDLQRPRATASAQLFPDRFVPAAMLPQSPGVDPATCIPELASVRRGARLRRDQPQPRPVGRALDRAAADRPVLVPDLREDGRVRHPGDGPRQHQLQPVLPHHRRALPQRRHHGLHAVLIQGDLFTDFPDPALGHPARRRRGALPLGPVPRPGAGAEEAAARRSTCWATSSSTPASTTSPASIC